MTSRWLKRMSGILVLLVVTFSLIGCGQSEKKSTGDKPAPGKVQRISIIGGSSSGSWYLVAGGMAKVINKYVPGVEATAEPGGGAENIIRVASKEVMFGMVMSDNLYYANKGTREFKEAYPQVVAVYGGHDNPMKLMVRADSGINSVADLKGKKIGMGYPGSSQAVTAVADMETLGFKVDKDYKALWLTPGEISEALQDKTIDAGFIYIADPSGAMVDLCTKIPIKFLTYDVDKIVQAHPYWYKTKVKAGLYKGLDSDYYVQGANVVLVTHKDTDPELVYKVTKALIEHSDEVAEAHPAGKEWNLQGATRGIATPFHPGAEKYLKEKGALK